MAHEAQLWATLRDAMKPHGHFDRIENMVGVGRPDVNYCLRGVTGDIELKHVTTWPRSPDTPLAVPHYTSVQRVWANARLRAGGRVYVLLQVERRYLLLNAWWTRTALGKTATKRDILNADMLLQPGAGFPAEAMERCLTGPFTFRG